MTYYSVIINNHNQVELCEAEAWLFSEDGEVQRSPNSINPKWTEEPA